ncbi:unnamed protein product [Lampetra planeri]
MMEGKCKVDQCKVDQCKPRAAHPKAVLVVAGLCADRARVAHRSGAWPLRWATRYVVRVLCGEAHEREGASSRLLGEAGGRVELTVTGCSHLCTICPFHRERSASTAADGACALEPLTSERRRRLLPHLAYLADIVLGETSSSPCRVADTTDDDHAASSLMESSSCCSCRRRRLH